MIKNYLKIAFRNLLKNKIYSSINIFGLAFGITCFILISIYLNNELSYDNFHNEADKIYRVLRIGNNENGEYNIGYTSGPFAKALLSDYPANIEEVTRAKRDNGVIEYKDKIFKEDKLFFADPNFFNFFNFPLIMGNKESVLKEANNVIISTEMAEKYFGDVNPIGEILKVDKQFDFIVTGVFDKSNLNSHLNFDFLGSLTLFERFDWFANWWNNNLSTYVKLSNPHSKNYLLSEFPNFMEKYFGNDFKKTGNKIGLTLEQLEDIYFNSDVMFDFVEHGDKSSIYIFAIIAFFILIIACINFTNLSIAISAKRAKEVGLRKVIGAQKKNIAYQFIGEAIIFSSFAFLLAIILVEFIQPYFSSFVGKELYITYDIESIIIASIAFITLIGLLAGIYPAFVLAALQPTKILKSETSISSSKGLLRQILVVTQFSISIVLIIGTIIISKQMNFLSNKKLGFNKEQIVLLNVDNQEFRNNFERFRDDLNRNTKILNVSGMTGEPGGFHDNLSYRVVEKGDDYVRMRSLFCDENYVETFGLNIIAGRDFSKEFTTDKTNSIMLNETAVKMLGYTPEEVLGKSIHINLFDSNFRKVVGVVADYNFSSLKNKIEPLAIACNTNFRKAAVKIKGSDVQEAIENIEKAYANVAPGYPFEYEFLDDKFDKLYKSERDAQILFRNFSITAIIIACLGLLGLVMYTAELKRKEIGIRKVLGASISGIVALISKEFVVLILIANIIAWPIAYYFVREWLNNFAYAISISLDSFIFSALITFAIALITISFQSIKTAISNPIKSIKYE